MDKNNKRKILLFLFYHILKYSFQYPENHCSQKHDDGYFIDPMHHSKIKICFLIWVWFSKHPEEIIAYCPYLKEILNIIFII